MTLDANTVLTRDDGAVSTNEDSTVIVTDGADDCDCCPGCTCGPCETAVGDTLDFGMPSGPFVVTGTPAYNAATYTAAGVPAGGPPDAGILGYNIIRDWLNAIPSTLTFTLTETHCPDGYALFQYSGAALPSIYGQAIAFPTIVSGTGVSGNTAIPITGYDPDYWRISFVVTADLVFDCVGPGSGFIFVTFRLNVTASVDYWAGGDAPNPGTRTFSQFTSTTLQPFTAAGIGTVAITSGHCGDVYTFPWYIDGNPSDTGDVLISNNTADAGHEGSMQFTH